MLTVSTTGSTAKLNPDPVTPSRLFYAMWLSIAGMALIGAGIPSATRKKRLLGVLLVCLMLAGLIFLVNCGGGSGNGGGNGSGGTPPGTYTITVKGTGQSVTNTATLTLTVQ